jgi:hypothetical protein
MKNKLTLSNKEFAIDKPGTKNLLLILCNKKIKITNLSVKYIKGKKMHHHPKLNNKIPNSIWLTAD